MTDEPADLLLDERELREALRPARPEPDDFARRLSERIGELEEREEEKRAKFFHAPRGLQWAASLLPPGVLPTAVLFSGAAGKKLSLKFLPALAAMPAISVGMILLTFVGALRAAFRRSPDGTRAPATPADEVMRAWWERNRWYAILSVVLLLGLIAVKHTETVVVALLASMLVAGLLTAELARNGLIQRRAVGRMAVGLVGGLGFYSLGLHGFLDLHGVRGYAINGVLIAGAAVCAWLSGLTGLEAIRRRIADPIPMKHPDRVTLFCLRCMSVAIATVSLVFAALLLWTAVATVLPNPPRRSELVEYVQGFAPDANGKSLELYGRVAARLEEDGQPWPRFPASVGKPPSEDPDALAVWFARSPARMEELADSFDLQAVLARPTFATGSLEAPSLLAWIRLERGTDEERDALARKLIASLPEAEEYRALSTTRSIASRLEELGRLAELDGERDRIHDMLREGWLAQGQDGAGFVPSAEFKGRRFLPPPPRADGSTTADAIWLMGRFGVPEEIDLERLRAGIEIRRMDALALGSLDTEGSVLSGLSHLDLQDFYSRSTWTTYFIDRRYMLGALLLVTLCLILVASAPREEPA